MQAQTLKILEGCEGFRANHYKDVAGKLTIGYGFLDEERIYSSPMSKEKAAKILIEKIKEFENHVDNYITAPINSRQKDAITLFTYQFGPNALKKSTLRRILNEGETDPTKIREAFEMWKNAGGKYHPVVFARSRMNADIFLGREYVRTPEKSGLGLIPISAWQGDKANQTTKIDKIVAIFFFGLIIVAAYLVGCHYIPQINIKNLWRESTS